MSYDMSIGDEHFNITYNIAPMFYSHNELGIRFIYGKTGKQAMGLLYKMLVHFKNNKDDLQEMNPINGWGSYDGTVRFIENIIEASNNNRRKKWRGD